MPSENPAAIRLTGGENSLDDVEICTGLKTTFVAETPSDICGWKIRGKKVGRPVMLLLSIRSTLRSRPDERATIYSETSFGDAVASQQYGPILSREMSNFISNEEEKEVEIESTLVIFVDSVFCIITQMSNFPRLSIEPIWKTLDCFFKLFSLFYTFSHIWMFSLYMYLYLTLAA